MLRDEPEAVESTLRLMGEYPSQLATFSEILDALVRDPTGLRRFLSAAAGRGKNFVKKCLADILKSAGLRVKVVVVAAVVAQGDDTGEGATIASTFNTFGAGTQSFDYNAYEFCPK